MTKPLETKDVGIVKAKEKKVKETPGLSKSKAQEVIIESSQKDVKSKEKATEREATRVVMLNPR